jgi:predicted RecB family nuclease
VEVSFVQTVLIILIKINMIKEPIKFYFDIENEPPVVRTWRKYQQDVIWKERDGYIWSFSGCYNDGKIFHYCLADFPLYKKNPCSDEALAKKLFECFEKAEIVIAHNGNAFDIKHVNALFAKYNLGVPSPYKKIDTLLVARNEFYFWSNSLNDLAEYLGIGVKEETGGYGLWRKVEQGSKKSISLMKKYNNHDVWLLREVYKKLRPYMHNHPNVGLFIGEKRACRNCGSLKLQKRGISMRINGAKWQKLQCQGCGKWQEAPKEDAQVR